jgi:hypothetical protein
MACRVELPSFPEQRRPDPLERNAISSHAIERFPRRNSVSLHSRECIRMSPPSVRNCVSSHTSTTSPTLDENSSIETSQTSSLTTSAHTTQGQDPTTTPIKDDAKRHASLLDNHMSDGTHQPKSGSASSSSESRNTSSPGIRQYTPRSTIGPTPEKENTKRRSSSSSRSRRRSQSIKSEDDGRKNNGNQDANKSPTKSSRSKVHRVRDEPGTPSRSSHSRSGHSRSGHSRSSPSRSRRSRSRSKTSSKPCSSGSPSEHRSSQRPRSSSQPRRNSKASQPPRPPRFYTPQTAPTGESEKLSPEKLLRFLKNLPFGG